MVRNKYGKTRTITNGKLALICDTDYGFGSKKPKRYIVDIQVAKTGWGFKKIKTIRICCKYNKTVHS